MEVNVELIKYDAACRAVAEAKSLDDVKEIKNVCEAARAYAKMARNRDMEIDAIEIRVRAERKEGELIGVLKKQGMCIQGNTNGDPATPPRITLKDIGIDGATSAIAQRLALLPASRFETELQDWRAKASMAVRLETPLQVYRIPSIRGDRQKAASRLGRHKLEAKDPLDRFRAPDGRRIADWRWGELARIEQLAHRVLRCVGALYASHNIANPDPLSTMEMTFGGTLAGILDPIWDSPVDPGDAGINQMRIDESRARRARQCEHCGSNFVARNPSGQARAGKSNEGRFCSRKCVHEARKSAARKSDDNGTDKTEIRPRG